MERRDFIKNGGRLFLLGGLATGIGYLASKGQISQPGQCKISSNCAGCSKVLKCNYKKAEQYRNQVFLSK